MTVTRERRSTAGSLNDLAGWSVGVEEEFLLVDPRTGGPVPAVTEVLAAARAFPAPADDARLHRELLATQVEAATGRCLSMRELGGQLFEARRLLAHAADPLLLVPSGTPVLPGEPAVTRGERFARIAELYAGVVADYQACGCHVHVGVPDLDTAVGVVNHVRPWLPTLLALSVNSPVHHGVDTGFASWRMVEQSRFPGAGVPPRFTSARDYRARVERLVSAGVLADETQSFWLVRPSPRLPTVEFRVADVSIDVDGALLQAALCRALVRTALGSLVAGRPALDADDQVLAAAVWSAARYGLAGPAVHPLLARRVPAADLVCDLVETVRPALRETGDLTLVEVLLRRLTTTGTGADRQRAAKVPERIVRMLAESATQPGDTHD